MGSVSRKSTESLTEFHTEFHTETTTELHTEPLTELHTEPLTEYLTELITGFQILSLTFSKFIYRPFLRLDFHRYWNTLAHPIPFGKSYFQKVFVPKCFEVTVSGLPPNIPRPTESNHIRNRLYSCSILIP
jgi:hypothetical protein